jgi:type III restriction enzyme
MSVQFHIAEQVLRVDDKRDATEAVVHKYDAFLNLLCADRFLFQRDAVREALRFLVSNKYADLGRLARENWNAKPAIQQRHESLDAYLDKMPLRDRKAVSLDLATGTGKSFVMYALATIALAEGLVDRVLVLCPSLTIEEGLLEKFSTLAGNAELSGIMKELGAAVAIPGIKRGNVTTGAGDICIENIHAVYENAGSSIGDSFGKGKGAQTLVLNDEAHHLFSPPDKGLKEWLKFLLNADYGFRFIVNFTGTAYTNDDYFPDVVYRYGLKQAIADKVVKKPNYKLEETYRAHDWQNTYAIHGKNREELRQAREAYQHCRDAGNRAVRGSLAGVGRVSREEGEGQPDRRGEEGDLGHVRRAEQRGRQGAS